MHETLILTSQGGNGGRSYGNWAWFAIDLRLWLEEGDIVYGGNGSAYTIGDDKNITTKMEYHKCGLILMLLGFLLIEFLQHKYSIVHY